MSDLSMDPQTAEHRRIDRVMRQDLVAVYGQRMRLVSWRWLPKAPRQALWQNTLRGRAANADDCRL